MEKAWGDSKRTKRRSLGNDQVGRGREKLPPQEGSHLLREPAQETRGLWDPIGSLGNQPQTVMVYGSKKNYSLETGAYSHIPFSKI